MQGGLNRGGLIKLDVICILEIHKETKISKHWRLWMIVRLIIEYLLFDVIKSDWQRLELEQYVDGKKVRLKKDNANNLNKK